MNNFSEGNLPDPVVILREPAKWRPYVSHEVSLTKARRLFLDAQSRDSLVELRTNVTPEGALLRARCLIRLREPAKAVVALEVLTGRVLPDPLQAEYHVLQYAALNDAGVPEASRGYMESAQRAVAELGGAAAAELLLLRARAAVGDHELKTARSLVFEATNVAPIPGDRYARTHGLIRAESHETAALIAGIEEDFIRQAALLDRAWLELETLPIGERDHWVCASLLRERAPLIVDLGLRDDAAVLADQAECVACTPETLATRWAVTRALGWNAAVRGIHVAAFRYFRDAIDIAPSALCRLVSTLDRADLAAGTRQDIILAEETSRAYSIARSINWSSVGCQESTVLLAVAEICSREDVVIARSWLDQFDRDRKERQRRLLGTSQRQAATEDDAHATVLAAEGRLEASVTARRRALSTWDALAHRWRAARSAVAIAEITKCSDDLVVARDRADEFRHSWLGRRASRIVSWERSRMTGRRRNVPHA